MSHRGIAQAIRAGKQYFLNSADSSGYIYRGIAYIRPGNDDADGVHDDADGVHASLEWCSSSRSARPLAS